MPYNDLMDVSAYQEHIREVVINGRIHRIAELDTVLDYRIVVLGHKWFHGIIPQIYMSKVLIEKNEITKNCKLWESYAFTGKVVIDLTYGRYRRTWLYPSKIMQIPNLPFYN